jgi:hypothetical protein
MLEGVAVNPEALVAGATAYEQLVAEAVDLAGRTSTALAGAAAACGVPGLAVALTELDGAQRQRMIDLGKLYASIGGGVEQAGQQYRATDMSSARGYDDVAEEVP